MLKKEEQNIFLEISGTNKINSFINNLLKNNNKNINNNKLNEIKINNYLYTINAGYYSINENNYINNKEVDKDEISLNNKNLECVINQL